MQAIPLASATLESLIETMRTLIKLGALLQQPAERTLHARHGPYQ